MDVNVFRRLLVLTLLMVIFGDLQGSEMEDDIFVLPFGLKNKDAFINKRLNACSGKIQLSRSFHFFNEVVDSLYVCSNGYVDFTSPSELYDFEGFNSSGNSMIAVGLLELNLKDYFADYACEDIYNYVFNMGYDYEKPCAHKLFSEKFQPNLVVYSGLRPSVRRQLRAWKDNVFNVSDINVTFDDEISRVLLRSQDQINAAGNVWYRHVSEKEDFDRIAFALNQSFAGFDPDFAFVVTWYKIATASGGVKTENSYQLIITCGVNSTLESRCFVLMDYHDLDWDLYNYLGSSSVIGFKSGGNSLTLDYDYEYPSRRIVTGNSGIPKLWIFEIGTDMGLFFDTGMEQHNATDYYFWDYGVDEGVFTDYYVIDDDDDVIDDDDDDDSDSDFVDFVDNGAALPTSLGPATAIITLIIKI